MTKLMKTIVLGPPGTGKTTTLLNKVDDYNDYCPSGREWT